MSALKAYTKTTCPEILLDIFLHTLLFKNCKNFLRVFQRKPKKLNFMFFHEIKATKQIQKILLTKQEIGVIAIWSNEKPAEKAEKF